MADGDIAFRSAPFQVGPASPANAPRLRVFLYSHDTFGLGHLRRNLAIADALLAPEQECDVLLLSGSPVIRTWALPD